MNLMNAIGGIGDKHIEEFAYISPKKRRIRPWQMIAAAAAGFAAVIAAVFVSIPNNKINFGNSEIGFAEFTSWAYYPIVYFNDRVYGYQERHDTNDEFPEHPADNASYSENVSHAVTDCIHSEHGYSERIHSEHGYSELGYSELPEGYIEVGEITTNDPNDKIVNGFATGLVRGLNVGDKIYQAPDHLEDLYVYTILFMDDEYRYYHFIVNETYYSLRINGKTYVRDLTSDELFLYELPDGYAEVGEVTTNERKNKYVDGFGRELYIGDKIFSSTENPDIVYVYTNRFSTPLCYVRYIACEE